MDHHTPAAIVPLAPSPSTTADPPTSLEHEVGALVAAAAGVLAAGLHEHARGKLSLRTRARGGDLIFALYSLRCLMIADWDFDGICRRYGAAVLREQCGCGSEVDAATIDELVGAVMDLLRKVVCATSH